ncbi:MAG: hypothetical protein JJU28_14585 [Cyclobacteriaceae bacterium]|nr:hypothetical protein [Cyclobacteriaceae bacterium]
MKKIYLIFVILCAILYSCDMQGDNMRIGPTQGAAGSMARFALAQGHLYVVKSTMLSVYKIQGSGALEFVNEAVIGFGIETIFTRGNTLFIGANDAVYIYDISQPDIPVQLAAYRHLIACDPVVVQGNYAYATLRIADCRTTGEDVLEIIDVSDLRNPSLAARVPMESPYGLGVDGDKLFICEGNKGLKVFNLSDPVSPVLKQTYPEMHAWDVIPYQGILIMTGNDGIAQYDYRPADTLIFLSKIKVQK